MTFLLWGQHYVLANVQSKVVVHGYYQREEAIQCKQYTKHTDSTANVAENHHFEVEVVGADKTLLTVDLQLSGVWRIP